MNEITDGKVIPIGIEHEMKKSYLLYSMSVIVGRALPDVRDGLKPIHRRILYALNELNLTPDKAHRKSVLVVGEVMGKYHPHGDAAIYDAMVRMAQDFSSRYTLVDGHGNFGSIDGDSPAAMRYTEVRMDKLAIEMLSDINKDTVDFAPNFDGSLQEPIVLPSRFPNLLVNGSSGIAVGMATNIPPHNLGEVIDAVVALIDNPEITIEGLMKHIKGPDFPTAGLILGRDGIENAYKTGRGSIKMRARAFIETLKSGKSRIIVTEIPYQVNKARLIEKIAELHRDKKIEGITELRDESDRNGMRIVIELRKDVIPHVVLNQLYKHTQLQETFGVIMLVLVDGEPRVLNLKEILHYYVEHQKDIIIRRTRFDLNKALDRAHILEGLLIALDNIDEVVQIIRSSRDREMAEERLMERFGLSDRQAKSILDMRLHRLTGLERDQLEAEYDEVLALIDKLRGILADERKVLGVVKEEILAIKAKYGDPRLTEIVAAEGEIAIEDLIADEDIVVTLTHQGYIKRLPLGTYKSQRRGGKGITGLHTKDEDFVEDLFITSTHSNILCITDKGRAYAIKGYDIPEAGRQARGMAIINLINLEPGERVNEIIPVKDFSPDNYLFFGTKNGIVKKTSLNEYQSIRRSGLIAISFDEGDKLIGAKMTAGDQEIILVTKQGQSIRFSETDVRPMGRTARGVIGIKLDEGDEVVGMDTVKSDADLLVITEKGYGKRTSLEEYGSQNRGGKGIKTLNITAKNGFIVGIMVIKDMHDLVMITSEGIIIRMKATDISVMGRNTQGVKLINLTEEDTLVSVAKVAVKDDDEEDDSDQVDLVVDSEEENGEEE